jgi:hypothetical protein
MANINRKSAMAHMRDNGQPSLKYHLKVHVFRTLTLILAWLMLVVAFYEKPEVLTGTQRLVQHGIETIGDAIPSPWGPRIEFVFREIGGLIWLQITLLVVVLRVVLSTVSVTFRSLVGRN